ncbi:MAG: hypothetical protein EPO40_09090 [Myxococcaceae bacterium]|nr:MAG: hypothetical protein EPO40_09090 [Myxococcaceae bacterium]
MKVKRPGAAAAATAGSAAPGTRRASAGSAGGGDPQRGGGPARQGAPVDAQSTEVQSVRMRRAPSQRAVQVVDIDAPEVKKGV